MTDQINEKSANYYMIHRRSYPDDWDIFTVNVFANMASYANGSGQCFATQETIAKDCRTSVSTVKNCIKYLCSHGYIKDLTPNKRYFKAYEIVDRGHHLTSKSPPDFEGTTRLRGHGAPTESKYKVKHNKRKINKKDILRSTDRIPRTPMIFSGKRTPVEYANKPERRIIKPKNNQPDALIPEDDPINPEVPKKPSKPPVPHKVLCKVFQDVAQSIPGGALGKNVKEFRDTYGVTKENVEDIANVLRDFYTPETGTWEMVELGWNSAGCYYHNRPTPHQIVSDFQKVLDYSIDGDEYKTLQDAINGSMSPKGDIGRGLAKNFYNHFKKNVSSINQLVDLIDSTFGNEGRWLQWRFSDGTGGEPKRDYWLIYNTLEHVFKERNQTPAW